MFLAATAWAQWLSAGSSVLLLLLLPLLRYAVRSLFRDEIEVRVQPKLDAIGHRIDDHMHREEDEMTRWTERMHSIDKRLYAIEMRGRPPGDLSAMPMPVTPPPTAAP